MLKFNLDQVAFIEEQSCIGCTKCIRFCPVDAILGAAKQMHSILMNECIGCELCVASCPVNCISMRPIAKPDEEQQKQATLRAQRRSAFREFRLKRSKQEKTRREDTIPARKAAIHAAYLRAQAKKLNVLPH